MIVVSEIAVLKKSKTSPKRKKLIIVSIPVLFFTVLCRVQYLKKTAAFLLLCIYMLSATATREILKLPLLVEHYYDHLEENKSAGLVSFLAMHYYIEDGTDTDAAEDNQLPFKSAEYAVSFSFTSVTPPAITGALAKPENENNQSFRMHSELFLPSQYTAAIWQPPRNC